MQSMHKDGGKKEKREISRCEYMKWYLSHDDDCFMNHDGSSGVCISNPYIIIIFFHCLLPVISTGN